MAEGLPKFTWSASRLGTFTQCKRQYYYQYYGYHGGWWRGKHPPRSDAAEQIYFFKKLETVPMWLGSRIHEWIAELLVGKEQSEILLLAQQDIIRGWEQMQRNYSMWQERPHGHKIKQHPFFLESIIQDQLDERILEFSTEKMSNCLQAVIDEEIPELFEKSRRDNLYTFVEQVEEPWTLGIELEPPPAYARENTSDDLFVHAILDCAIETSPGKYKIFDWKTGAPAKDDMKTNQLILYSEWLLRERRKKISDPGVEIEAYEVNLPSFNLRGGRITASDLGHSQSTIISESSAAADLHLELRDQLNVLYGEDKRDDKALELFSAEPCNSACGSCNWQTYCAEGKEFLDS
jgi:hypothetical protein